MPLRDHFHPPISTRSSWEGLHGGWPMMIVERLAAILPERYVAEPRVHLGSRAEVDIAAFDAGDPLMSAWRDSRGGVATAWSPTAPTLAVETELASEDEYEVRVYDADRGRLLVAAIELVSPRNKDRPESRGHFVGKCAALLRQQVCVVLVDPVTARKGNLYSELLESVGEHDPSLGADPPNLYAVSCRWGERDFAGWLEAWNRPMAIGEPLPTLPLWLSDDLAIPLDLEASYEQTCRNLRIA